jgi:hypothetical protein
MVEGLQGKHQKPYAIRGIKVRRSFATVEEAFVSARLFAGREWARLQRAALENPSSPPLEIVDTEWGYDLRQGHAILARVWVHERQTVESA